MDALTIALLTFFTFLPATVIFLIFYYAYKRYCYNPHRARYVQPLPQDYA
jgi:hypothetical protein